MIFFPNRSPGFKIKAKNHAHVRDFSDEIHQVIVHCNYEIFQRFTRGILWKRKGYELFCYRSNIQISETVLKLKTKLASAHYKLDLALPVIRTGGIYRKARNLEYFGETVYPILIPQLQKRMVYSPTGTQRYNISLLCILFNVSMKHTR